MVRFNWDEVDLVAWSLIAGIVLCVIADLVIF